MFYVGQKVVCVDDEDAPTLKLSAVYTVKAIRSRLGVNRDGTLTPGIFLQEVIPILGIAYDPRRFRPAVERKTDISIFQKMLTPNKRVKESVK
jgi:hypothetical protein